LNAVEAIRVARRVGARLTAEGASLVLDAVNPPPLVVIQALRTHKCEVLELLRDQAERGSIVEWLNAHPLSSEPDVCCWCGEAERADDVLLPFGVSPSGHAWLHSICWWPWQKRRQAEAKAALAATGVPPNSVLETER
jgi:hypothetical protein